MRSVGAEQVCSVAPDTPRSSSNPDQPLTSLRCFANEFPLSLVAHPSQLTRRSSELDHLQVLTAEAAARSSDPLRATALMWPANKLSLTWEERDSDGDPRGRRA